MVTSQRFGASKEASGWSDDVMYHDDDKSGYSFGSDKDQRRDREMGREYF